MSDHVERASPELDEIDDDLRAKTVEAWVPAIEENDVVVGGLLHDVGKLSEFHGFERTEKHDHLGHPYYGVSVAASVGLPPELVAITLNHTPVTNVDSATVEAALVS